VRHDIILLPAELVIAATLKYTFLLKLGTTKKRHREEDGSTF
jgi:hypothetical protein